MNSIEERLARLSPKQRAAFEAQLRRRVRTGDPDRIVRQPRNRGGFPLSFAQSQLWLVDQLEGGSPFYNIAYSFHLQGRLEVAALAGALSEVVGRHESLRTAFSDSAGNPEQVVMPVSPVELPVIDLSALPATESWREAKSWVALEAHLPFDLERGHLLRCWLLRLNATEHVLTCNLHHIIADWASVRILIEELTALYAAAVRGEGASLPELPLQMVDFAAWQRQRLSGAAYEAQIDYWRRQLASAPPLLSLRTDAPRPEIQSFRGACLEFTVPEDLTNALRHFTQEQGGTLFMTLLAAFQVLLRHLSGQDDLLVSTPVTYRTRPEIERVIGIFVNHLIFRVSFAGDPELKALLAEVRRVVLEAYAHQDVPFEKLVEELVPVRSLSYNPLIQASFNYIADDVDAEIEVSGLKVMPFGAELETAQFDLALVLMDGGAGLRGSLIYKRDLFVQSTINWLVFQLERVFRLFVEGATARCSEILRCLEAADEERRRDELRRLGSASYRMLRERRRAQPAGTLGPQEEVRPL